MALPFEFKLHCTCPWLSWTEQGAPEIKYQRKFSGDWHASKEFVNWLKEQGPDPTEVAKKMSLASIQVHNSTLGGMFAEGHLQTPDGKKTENELWSELNALCHQGEKQIGYLGCTLSIDLPKNFKNKDDSK